MVKGGCNKELVRHVLLYSRLHMFRGLGFSVDLLTTNYLYSTFGMYDGSAGCWSIVRQRHRPMVLSFPAGFLNRALSNKLQSRCEEDPGCLTGWTGRVRRLWRHPQVFVGRCAKSGWAATIFRHRGAIGTYQVCWDYGDARCDLFWFGCGQWLKVTIASG